MSFPDLLSKLHVLHGWQKQYTTTSRRESMNDYAPNFFEECYRDKLIKARETNRLRNEERVIQRQEANRPLPDRIKDWYEQLSPEERLQPYSMKQFVDLFNKAPSQIGLALYSLRWQRKRSFRQHEPFSRTWQAPTDIV
jgi:hypothetical protein